MLESLRTGRKPLALIVDDDGTTRLLLSKSLENEGFECKCAANGLEAVTAFITHAPDIVLLDVMMPELDGYGACEAIRKLPNGVHTPIVMLTGLEDAESIDRAYGVGATDFINKPIQWGLFRHRIRYIMRANQAFDELATNEANLAHAQRLAKLGSWEIQPKTQALRCSDEMLRILGMTPDEATRLDHIVERIHEEDRPRVRTALDRVLIGADFVGEGARIHASEHVVRYVRIQAIATRDATGAVSQVSGTMQDVTEIKEAEERIHFLVHHDGVTGLPNRTAFFDTAQRVVARSRRTHRLCAVLSLGIDNFKRVNDTLGHTKGNELLRSIATRLVETVREEDTLVVNSVSDRESLARFGGDEFTLILEDLAGVEAPARVATRLLDATRRPFQIDGQELFLTASVGISVFPADGDDPETLQRNSSTAMHYAKEQGRDSYQFYGRSMNASALERLAMESQLRRALERDEFVLHYQPKVDAQTGVLIGVEVLIRWNHPDLGMVAPGKFIPIAEQSGIIVGIEDWVLVQACRQVMAWRKETGRSVPVSVNISSPHFRDDLVGTVRRALEVSGLEPALLELEVTESMLMQDMQMTLAILDSLKALGVSLSLDDFGTGYSSLSYLKRFPLDFLKVDRSFVKDLPGDSENAAITQAIVAMAHSLHLVVIAEGVETVEQLSFLQDIHCDHVQGFLFSRPRPPEEIEALLREDGEGAPVILVEAAQA